MIIKIDNVEYSGLAEQPRDVLAAVAAVSEYVRTRGRAVMSIRVDGVHVPPDALVDTLQNKAAAKTETLEVTTEDIKGLVDNALSELEQVLPDLPQVCERLAEVFQSENPDSGYDPFHQLAAIWKTVKERQIQVASALDIDLNSATVDGKPIARHHAELNSLLNEAVEALQKNDVVTLGDLLEHELPPRAQMESRIVAMLRSRAQGNRA